MSTEADTCRAYILPRLIDAGWDEDPHSFTEQRTFTDGRIVVAGSKVRRRPQKRADYLLRYTRDFTIAVLEAKADYRAPGDGLQQASQCAQGDHAEIVSRLEERGITFHELAAATVEPDADPFDVLCHLVDNARLKSRRERGGCVRREERALCGQYPRRPLPS